MHVYECRARSYVQVNYCSSVAAIMATDESTQILLREEEGEEYDPSRRARLASASLGSSTSSYEVINSTHKGSIYR